MVTRATYFEVMTYVRMIFSFSLRTPSSEAAGMIAGIISKGRARISVAILALTS
ncbi:hypothetical protein D3C83_323860 [compost metagenome]